MFSWYIFIVNAYSSIMLYKVSFTAIANICSDSAPDITLEHWTLNVKSVVKNILVLVIFGTESNRDNSKSDKRHINSFNA